MFEYQAAEKIDGATLTMDYSLVPWDTDIIGCPVAEIRNILVQDPKTAEQEFAVFLEWCRRKRISLCSCRIPHDHIVEAFFLESQGFRFIELNYRPELSELGQLQFPKSEVTVVAADKELDREPLAEMAAKIFKHGRFHQDPFLGPEIGNKRYRVWMVNAFLNPKQKIFKCVIEGRTVAFFVVEYRKPNHSFWSLVGLAPGLSGSGLGKRVWPAMLRHNQLEGMESVSTSISSHNTAVFNLYVRLGFRFQRPYATFHYHSAEFPLF